MPNDPKKALSEESKRLSMLALRALKDLLADGQITPSEFLTSFLQELKEEYIRQYILGIGGVDNMQPSDWGSIGGNLGSQYRYARDFGGLIEDGELSDAQIEARLDLYGESSDEIFELANYRRHELDGYTHERWILDDDKENCADCLALADLGWVELGTLPTPCDGSTACMNNCGCYKEYGVYDYERSINREGNSNSGNYGHGGRPGEVGGSAPTSGVSLSRDILAGTSDDTYRLIDSVSANLSRKWDIEESALDALLKEENPQYDTSTPFEEKKEAYINILLRNWAGSSGDEPSKVAIQGAANYAGINIPEGLVSSEVQEWMAANPGTEEGLQNLGRLIYEETQSRLEDNGIQTVHLYRAESPEANRDRAFSSWSGTYGGFITTSVDYERIEADIPARYLFSLPATGFGTLAESEVVVLGNYEEYIAEETGEEITK